jgi:hypothetical protein
VWLRRVTCQKQSVSIVSICQTESEMPALKFEKTVFAAVVILLCIIAPQLNGQRQNDPHRPACTSASCKKIESFLRVHFCGASPFGNGPENGCDTRYSKQLLTGVNVLAAFDCETSVTDGRPKCRQRTEPSPTARSILVREMRQLGLPTKSGEGRLLYRLAAAVREMVPCRGGLWRGEWRSTSALPDHYCC